MLKSTFFARRITICQTKFRYMKKLLRLFCLLGWLALSGCLDITEEITIHEDDSGTWKSTSDMSAAIGMMKMMGGEQGDEMQNMKKDTVISFASFVDSIPDLTDAQKDILKKAELKISMDVPEEKMMLTIETPYDSPEEFNQLKALMGKVSGTVLGKQLTGLMPGEEKEEETEMADTTGQKGGDLSVYFDLSYEHGRISRKLNEEKYDGKDADQGLQMMKEMGGMGTPMMFRTIINLPRPATKAEGKNVQLSEDKQKITIENTLDDFFDEPGKFEFTIEY